MAGWYHGVRLLDDKHQEIEMPVVAGKPRVSCMPYTYDIAEENVFNHVAWEKLGYNSDVQTAEEIISPQGGTYVFLTAETQLYAIMDSPADRNVGSGIGSLTVYYLDDNYVEYSTDVTLNAASVALSVANVFRVNDVRAKTVGTNGKAVGNIKIADAGGLITYGYIAAGNTIDRQAVFTVPANKSLYITQPDIFAIHTAANKRAIITLKATYDTLLGAALTAGLFFMPRVEVILSDAQIPIPYTFPKKFGEKTDIIVVGNSNGTASVSIAMEGWLESN